MDYEDNDFHSQTFQLAGEENIKFSPGLHSYSLPKFDLDDTLQAHLRFDSLVDSEALLGIHGQEENQWIEDFSRESSGLEFSSSAVESCSILRRNNVWSEATSSESVDLLLKSVGQDDMKIMERPIIEESDICDGLDCLTNQMKHNMDQEASKTENVACVDSTSPLESLDRFSGLDMGAVDQVPSIDSNTLEGEGERSVDGDSGALSVIEEECRESLVSNENLDVAKLKENTNLFDKSEGNTSAVTSQCMDVNTSTALVQTFVNAGVGNSHQVLQRAEDLGKGNDSIVGDHHVISRLVDSQTSEGRVDHDHDHSKNMGNPSSWVEKVESMPQVPELSSDSNFTQNMVDSSKDEQIASSKEIDMVDKYIGNPQEASLLVVGGVDTAEISASASGNLSIQGMPICVQTAQGCSNSEPLLEQDGLPENVGQQTGALISVSNAESLSVEEQTVSQGQGNESSDVHLEYSASLVKEVGFSTSINHEFQTSENTNEMDDGLRVSNAENCGSYSLLAESLQRCDQLSDGHVEYSASLVKEVGSSTNITHESRKSDSIKESDDGFRVCNAEKCGSSSLLVEPLQRCDPISTETRDVYISHPDASPLGKENERFSADSVSTAVGPEVVNIASDNILDGDHYSLSNSSKKEAIERKEELDLHVDNSPLVVEQEETVTTISTEPSILGTEESSLVSNEWAPSLKRHATCDIVAKVPVEIVAPSSFSAGYSGNMCQNEPESHVTNLPAQQCSQLLEDCPVTDDIAVVANEGAEVCDEYNNEAVSTKAEGINPMLEDTHSQPLLPSSCGPSHDIGLKDIENNLTSENDNGLRSAPASTDDGVSFNEFTGTFCPASVSEGDTEGHALEAGSSNLVSAEPNCGSPTIISCSDASHIEKQLQEGSLGSLDQTDSDALQQEVNKVGTSASDHKGNDSFEDDRSFTFKVSSLEDLSEKETVSGWKPFSSIPPYRVSQTVGSSCTSTSGFCAIDSKSLEEISCGNHQISSKSNTLESSVWNNEDRTSLTAGKTAQDETAKEGKLQNDELLRVEREHQEEVGRLDQSTAHVSVSTINNSKESNAAEVDRKLAFDISSLRNLSEKETCHNWKPVHSVQPYEFPQAVGVSTPTTSVVGQIDANALKEISRECRTSGVKNVRRNYKGNAEGKTRLSPGKAANKENAKEGKFLKETVSMKHTKAGGSNFLHASPTSPQFVQAGDMRAIGFIDNNSKLSGVVTTIQTSNLPDLNTATSSYALFHQPFTDSQQVQLRAQIFVYGSIIQGTAPSEECMVAAFGEYDGGRSAWENIWRVAVERLHNQKSPLSNAKTPPQPQAGTRATEQATRQSVHRSEAVCTPCGADSNKIPAVVFSPSMPFSSPVWTMSTAGRDGLLSSNIAKGPLVDSSKSFLPSQPYQTSHVRPYVGNTSPWLTQAPPPGTWVFTPQTAGTEASVHHPIPISETVRVTSVRESSIPQYSGLQHSLPSPFTHTFSTPSAPAGNSFVIDTKGNTVSTGRHTSAESKPRKKRKNVISEELGQISSVVQAQRDPVSMTAQAPTSLATTTTISSAINVPSASVISASSPISSIPSKMFGGVGTEKKVVFLDEMCGKIEQAKRQAEDAAALAATAVGHCQSTWNQLAIQKNSGLIPDVEAKLASSAVAIAAAASVAKAAAAIAKVASHAALQAKLMADEALATSSGDSTESALPDDVKYLGRATPSSILKDKTNNADSVLVSVREAAKTRVEAASSAAKRAENLDAVLKAAEMTAEAVSQAGAIIAMGEPIPFTLTELVDAGAEGYWKAHQTSPEQHVKSNDVLSKELYKGVLEAGIGRSDEQFNVQLSGKIDPKDDIDQGKVLSPKELSVYSTENRLLVNDLHSDTVSSCEKALEVEKSSTEYDLSKTVGVVPESQVASENTFFTIQKDEVGGHQLVKKIDIKEGSLVEVRSDEEDLRMVWYMAKVLNLEDGKAFVSYTEPIRHEGSSWHNEWVPLDGGGKEPRLRIARPMSVINDEGTKKRRRAARGDYTWCVGDKVEAWIRDGIKASHFCVLQPCWKNTLLTLQDGGVKPNPYGLNVTVGHWWEGIITDKNKEDETNLTVHFPVKGDTSVVRAWDLRPSLIWENGKWTEWCCSMEKNCLSLDGITSHEKPPKRSKLDCDADPGVEAKGMGKMSKLPGIVELGKPEALKPLALSAKERVFTVGKNTTEGKSFDALGRKRTAVQKEGSRVIFGVPKPGKKRKFMEVSKHYISDKGGKISERTDSDTLAKFLKPQEPASRGWQNSSKVVPKGKQIAESKTKMLKSGKSQTIGSKTTTGNDNNLTSIVSSIDHGSVQDPLSSVNIHVSREGSISEKSIPQATVPNNKKTAEGSVLFSSSDVVSDSVSSRKKSYDVADQSKRKATHFGEKGVKSNEKGNGRDHLGNFIRNTVEPRRSNRRIQPTSRLLEGIQSSLTVSKIPASSHDRGTKAQQKSSRGRNHG
ncbi:hypothetical protein IFM89_027167 [Coptis chinensis]|uniref:Agenet domain-containing protein n=1 Tax=Coptis chinensis TaxID=261450 RepID=A0A835IE41_9MAGN|nr:hypothetical protein IFM89_027167 [Coptis chinensis]